MALTVSARVVPLVSGIFVEIIGKVCARLNRGARGVEWLPHRRWATNGAMFACLMRSTSIPAFKMAPAGLVWVTSVPLA